MTLRLSNFRLPFDHSQEDFKQGVAKKLKIPQEAIKDFSLVRKALDARLKKNNNGLFYVYTVDLQLERGEKELVNRLGNPDLKLFQRTEVPPLLPGSEPLTERPIIVGAGPAGIFAALTLASYGYRPLILERGREVAARAGDVTRFWEEGNFCPESNVQYGEGGAGTFSDGKLTTRINDPRISRVLEALVAAGAPPEILYLHKPHIGTDKLRQVVQNLRQQILEQGGEIRFQAKVTDLIIEQGQVSGVVVNNEQELKSPIIVLAAGHSAREIYRLLFEKGAALTAKPLAVGGESGASAKTYR